MSNIYAYVRASDVKQEASCGVQVSHSQTAAESYDGTWTEAIEDDAVSGSVPFAKRKGGNYLLNTIQPGDHVIVTKLDRLGRNTIDTMTTIETLRVKGVKLHVLNFSGGQALNLETDPASKLFATVLAAVGEMERGLIQQRTTEALAHRKAQGLACTGQPLYGMKRVWRDKAGNDVPVKKSNHHRVTLKLDVWDLGECDLIREIRRRVLGGETQWAVAVDFHKRGLVTSYVDEDGRPMLWVKKHTRGTKRGQVAENRVVRVFRWYCRVRDAGLDIGGLSDVDLRGMFPTR